MNEYDADIERLVGTGASGGNLPVIAESRELTPHAMGGGGAFEGASRFNKELALWHPPIQSADMDILDGKEMTDARARDLMRNDAYVASGEALHRDNIVGSLYMLNAKPEAGILGLDEAWVTAMQEEVETKFGLYAESPSNWIDATRVNTFTGLVRLAVGIYVAAGEVLAAAEWIRDDPLRHYKTAIQMTDIDRLSNPYGAMDTPVLRQGVAKDGHGAPIGYHIRMTHPSDWINPDSYKWKFIPRTKPWGREQMIHIFEQRRADQTRGISQMVAALKEMKTTKKFRDIVLQNAVVNATYAASIESDLPSEAVFAQMGAGNIGTAGTGEVISQYAAAFLGAIADYAGSSKNMAIDGVKIPHLFPGTKLQLRPAGTPGGVGQDFENSLLRYIASNLGVSYEQLSKDFSKTSYAGFKGGLNETRKYMSSRKKAVADRFASAIYRLWFEEAMNYGDLDCMKGKESLFYDGMNKDAFCSCDWIGASAGQIDELKETQAAVLRLNNNLSTHEEEAGKLGKDWRRLFAQKQREKKDMKAKDILPATDTNMMNAATGTNKAGAKKSPTNGGTSSPNSAADDAPRETLEAPLLAIIGEALIRANDGQAQMVAAQAQLVEAVTALAKKPQRPVHLAVEPHVAVTVESKQNGKTRTQIVAHDDKGRIMETVTTPEE